MTDEEIINETIRLQNQLQHLIKATYIVVVLTIIADIVLILVKLGVIK